MPAGAGLCPVVFRMFYFNHFMQVSRTEIETRISNEKRCLLFPRVSVSPVFFLFFSLFFSFFLSLPVHVYAKVFDR